MRYVYEGKQIEKEVLKVGALVQGEVSVVHANGDLIVLLENYESEDGKVYKELEAIIKYDEFSTQPIKVQNMRYKMNTPVQGRIVKMTEENGELQIEISRKQLQEEASKYLYENLNCGDIIEACALDASDTMYYVDIGAGVKACIYRENLCIMGVDNPRDFFNKRQVIKAVVLNKKDGRIILSHRELLGTFKENVEASGIKEGDSVVGQVRKVDLTKKRCIYVNLFQNLQGFLDVTPETSKLQAGDYIAVNVKTLNVDTAACKLRIISDAPVDGSGKRCKYKKGEVEYLIPEGTDYMESWSYYKGSDKNIKADIRTDFVCAAAAVL